MSYPRPVISKRPSMPAGKLVPVTDFAPNPGKLAGNIYLPMNSPSEMPLVTVLHGCTQNGVDYAAAAGWIELADRHGFALLIPQQQQSNNFNLCFNWFERGDTQRDMGEAASIKAMIDSVMANQALDPSKIFITGLSAGAAMAATMLACYPEIFAGGGLIAGLPHGIASSMSNALLQMRRGPNKSGAALAAHVTGATDYAGPWPRISVWHGNADRTVSAINGEASVTQWLTVHDLEDAIAETRQTADICHRSWRDGQGQVQVEHIAIAGMGHGTPIDPHAMDGVGKAGPYVLDAGIGSSEHMVAFWRIGENSRQPVATLAQNLSARPSSQPAVTLPMSAPLNYNDTGVGKIINDALRAAGLMR